MNMSIGLKLKPQQPQATSQENPSMQTQTQSTQTVYSVKAGVDVGNNLINIVKEHGRSLTFEAIYSDQVWFTNAKAEAFYKRLELLPDMAVGATYPQQPHLVSDRVQWFPEGAVILQQRHDIPGLETILGLIEIGAGTIDLSLVDTVGNVRTLSSPCSDGGVVTLLNEIAESEAFQSSVRSPKPLTSRFHAAQVGFILASLGTGNTAVEGDDLVFKGIRLEGFLKRFAPSLAASLGQRIEECQRNLITMADRYGYSDFSEPFNPDRIALAGGGAELLKFLSKYCDIAAEIHGRYLWSTRIPDGFLNAYCAYRAAGGKRKWPE